MKNMIDRIFLLLLIATPSSLAMEGNPVLCVSGSSAPGGMLTANFVGGTTGRNPWIALYDDAGSILSWDYVSPNVSAASWSAVLPQMAGTYTFGYHDDDGGSIASLGVTVISAPPPPPSSGKQWILDNFSGLPVYEGQFTGVIDVVYPALVRDANCVGGWYCFSVSGQDPYTLLPAQASSDKRLALVNVTIGKGWVNGIYGASLITNNTAEPAMDVFMSNVTIAPDWPEWAGYAATNMDGFTFDMGWETGHVYLEDVMISGWADAAIDVKPAFLQAVRLHTEGRGFNTIKLWRPGPHYIVDSIINNERYVNDTSPAGDDGGLFWSLDCSTLVLNVYNSTFNGGATIPANGIACGSPGTPTINYLTVDPRTTGEMHPMFR